MSHISCQKVQMGCVYVCMCVCVCISVCNKKNKLVIKIVWVINSDCKEIEGVLYISSICEASPLQHLLLCTTFLTEILLIHLIYLVPIYKK